MGHDQSIEMVQGDPAGFERRFAGAFQREAGIDQDPGARGLEERGVSHTAAAEEADAHDPSYHEPLQSEALPSRATCPSIDMWA